MTNASEWIGPVGDVWAREWQRTDRSFAELARHLNAAILEHAPPARGMVLDIGCGAGATSIALAAARPDLDITGVDISPGLVDVARFRTAGQPNPRFVAGDVRAEVLRHGRRQGPKQGQIDLYVSRHGVMFFDDPAGAFAILRRAAAPGARLIFSCFRAAPLNSWASDVAAAILGAEPSPPAASAPPLDYRPGPFAFADPAFVRNMLTVAGWTVDPVVPVDFGYVAGGGVDPVADAVDFFQSIGPAAPVLRAAAPDDRAAMIDRIATVVARHQYGDTVVFPATAWLWSAHA